MTTSNQSTISFVFKLSGIVKIMTLLLFAQLLYKLFPDTSFPKHVILNSVVVFWEVSFTRLTELIVGRQKLLNFSKVSLDANILWLSHDSQSSAVLR